MSEINSDNREKDNKEESVKVPLMITNGMRQKLGELGLNKENISQLKPEDAWDILNGKKSYVETAGNAIPVPFPERKSDEKPLINKPEISPADKEEIEKLKKSINGVDNTEVSDKKNDNAEGNIGASKEWVRPERVKVEKTEEEKKHAADFLTKEILDKEDKDIKVSVKEVAREFRNLKNGEENLGKLRKYATIKKLNEEGLHIIRGEKAIEAYRQGKIEKFKEEIKQRDHERAVRIFEFTHAGLKEEQIEEFMEKEKNKLGLEGSEGTIVFDKLINGGYVVKEAKKSNFWFSKKNKIEKVSVEKILSGEVFTYDSKKDFFEKFLKEAVEDTSKEAEEMANQKVASARKKLVDTKNACAKEIIWQAVNEFDESIKNKQDKKPTENKESTIIPPVEPEAIKPPKLKFFRPKKTEEAVPNLPPDEKSKDESNPVEPETARPIILKTLGSEEKRQDEPVLPKTGEPNSEGKDPKPEEKMAPNVNFNYDDYNRMPLGDVLFEKLMAERKKLIMEGDGVATTEKWNKLMVLNEEANRMMSERLKNNSLEKPTEKEAGEVPESKNGQVTTAENIVSKAENLEDDKALTKSNNKANSLGELGISTTETVELEVEDEKPVKKTVRKSEKINKKEEEKKSIDSAYVKKQLTKFNLDLKSGKTVLPSRVDKLILNIKEAKEGGVDLSKIKMLDEKMEKIRKEATEDYINLQIARIVNDINRKKSKENLESSLDSLEKTLLDGRKFFQKKEASEIKKKIDKLKEEIAKVKDKIKKN